MLPGIAVMQLISSGMIEPYVKKQEHIVLKKQAFRENADDLANSNRLVAGFVTVPVVVFLCGVIGLLLTHSWILGILICLLGPEYLGLAVTLNDVFRRNKKICRLWLLKNRPDVKKFIELRAELKVTLKKKISN